MSIKRYVSTKDTTITDAYKENLATRATGSNMGASDSMEVFSIYAQASTGSLERSRILVHFPIEEIVADRAANNIPTAGNVKFYLKLSNAVHPFSTPRNFSLKVQAVSRSWDEGTGMDMEKYLDAGFANWEYAKSGEQWVNQGGDYHSSPVYYQTFEVGNENLNTDITDLVEEWIAGSKENNGIGVMLSGSHESGSVNSFYTKKFFTRGSEFFFKRPWIEAQFDSSKKDDRKSFYNSSSLAPAEDNLNLLYLYNRHRGKLVNIPAVGTGLIYLSLYSGSDGPEGNPLTLHNGLTSVTGGYASTGLYTASVALHTTLPYVFDVWHDNAGTQFITGSAITVLDPAGDDDLDSEIPEYSLSMTNLKPTYSRHETARFNLFARNKEWSPTIYTVASQPAAGISIEDAYFKLFRISDNLEVIPYGTGSMNHTRLSFDGKANYFDLDMKLLESGYSYGLKFTFKNSGRFYEQREMFKFRVEE
jgi:hypothetical protein